MVTQKATQEIIKHPASLLTTEQQMQQSLCSKKEWKKIIEGYSSRVITYPKDRLPTLAGVCREFQAFLDIGDTYLAGFWKSLLLSHLGWYSKIHHLGDRNLNGRYPEIPTWSWMSQKYQVYIDKIIHYSALLVDCTTELEDKNSPFGHVKGGKLTLRAKFVSHVSISWEGIANKILIRMDDLEDGAQTSIYLYLEDGAQTSIYLYLGQTTKTAIGLILHPSTDGNFVRVGQIQVPKADKELVWSNYLKPETLSII